MAFDGNPGPLGVANRVWGFNTITTIMGYVGIMEKKMEATISIL